jgi:hypothetical protein
MRFSILASIFVSALSVCAQTSQGDSFGWSVELLQGLTQLPTCAVRISSGSAALYTETPTRLTLTQGNCLTATLPQSRCGPTDLDCLCEDKEYQKSTEGCVLAVCTVKEALSESVQRPEPSVPANDLSQLPRRGRRKLARLLIATPESQLDGSAQAWSLLEESALHFGSSHDGDCKAARLDGMSSFSRYSSTMTAMLTLYQQLDNFRSLGTSDSFYGHIPHQFVQPV